MNNFNDRIYLLLTFKPKEFREYYFQTVSSIIAIAVYNLISVFIHTPKLISYWSLLVALLLISLIFIILNQNSIKIDWKFLELTKQRLEEEKIKSAEEGSKTVEEEPEPAEDEPSNEEVQMVEDEEDEFSFEDTLASLYNTGTAQQLSDVAVNGVEQKVRRMNIH